MKSIKNSLFAAALLVASTASSQTVSMTWDIFADRMPSSLHIQIVSDGKVMQDLDLRGSNALQLDIPIDITATLLVSTPTHKTRSIAIDTHYAFDDKKQAKDNKKFAYDLYLQDKKDNEDESGLLQSVSFAPGSSVILFDELLADEQ